MGGMTMKTAKERIHWINEIAKTDLGKAQGMLDMLNDVFGTDFSFLAKRVVFSETASDDVAGFYANCHDAEAWMDEMDSMMKF